MTDPLQIPANDQLAQKRTQLRMGVQQVQTMKKQLESLPANITAVKSRLVASLQDPATVEAFNAESTTALADLTTVINTL